LRWSRVVGGFCPVETTERGGVVSIKGRDEEEDNDDAVVVVDDDGVEEDKNEKRGFSEKPLPLGNNGEWWRCDE